MSLRRNLKTVTSPDWGKSSIYVDECVFYDLLVSFLSRWSFCKEKHPISSSLQGPYRLCQHFVIQHNGPQSFPVPLNYNKQEYFFFWDQASLSVKPLNLSCFSPHFSSALNQCGSSPKIALSLQVSRHWRAPITSIFLFGVFFPHFCFF